VATVFATSTLPLPFSPSSSCVARGPTITFSSSLAKLSLLRCVGPSPYTRVAFKNEQARPRPQLPDGSFVPSVVISVDCGQSGQEERTERGWCSWVFSTSDGSLTKKNRLKDAKHSHPSSLVDNTASAYWLLTGGRTPVSDTRPNRRVPGRFWPAWAGLSRSFSFPSRRIPDE